MNRETIAKLREDAERRIGEHEDYRAAFVVELLDEITAHLDETNRLQALVDGVKGTPNPKWPQVVAMSEHHSRAVRLVFTGTTFQLEKQWTDSMGALAWTNDGVEIVGDDDGRIDSGHALYAAIYALAFGEEKGS